MFTKEQLEQLKKQQEEMKKNGVQPDQNMKIQLGKPVKKQ